MTENKRKIKDVEKIKLKGQNNANEPKNNVSALGVVICTSQESGQNFLQSVGGGGVYLFPTRLLTSEDECKWF